MGVGMVRVSNGQLDAGIAAHEVGHQLGASHAGFANCGAVVLSTSCQVVVYGDLFDIMGNALDMGMMSASHLDLLGWLDNTNMQTVTNTGTFTLLPLTSTQTGIKVLKIPNADPGKTLYIEYRQPIGADIRLQNIQGTNVFDGVLIHKTFIDQTNNAPDALLIDASPPTDPKTPALLPNTSIAIPGTTVTITTLGKTATGIQVLVTMTGTTPVPSSPVNPTAQPTSGTNGTRLSVTLLLHGIGTGGDNVSPQATGISNPIHPSRLLTVDIYDANNQLKASKLGTVNFNPVAGNFQGIVDMGNLPTDVYVIKIRTDHFLRKMIPGIQQITSGILNIIPTAALVTGDTTNDNTLSVADYNLLLDCFSDLSQPKNCVDAAKKQATDINDDGNVNQFDYNLLLRELSVQSGQ